MIFSENNIEKAAVSQFIQKLNNLCNTDIPLANSPSQKNAWLVQGDTLGLISDQFLQIEVCHVYKEDDIYIPVIQKRLLRPADIHSEDIIQLYKSNGIYNFNFSINTRFLKINNVNTYERLFTDIAWQNINITPTYIQLIDPIIDKPINIPQNITKMSLIFETIYRMTDVVDWIHVVFAENPHISHIKVYLKNEHDSPRVYYNRLNAYNNKDLLN